MAVAALQRAMSAEDGNKLHPFFKRSRDIGKTPEAEQVESENVQDGDENTTEGLQDGMPEKPKRSKNRSAKKKSDQQPTKSRTQRTLGEIVNPTASGALATAPIPDQIDQNDGRRKRRRTSEHESIEVGGEDTIVSTEESRATEKDVQQAASPQVVISTSSDPPARSPVRSHDPAPTAVPQTPPKKLLRLKANGKFSSPVAKGPDEHIPPRRRSGRAKKPAGQADKRELVVRMRYGANDDHRVELGNKITRILAGAETVVTSTAKTTPKKRTPRKARPAKPTHPFFSLGGGKEPPTVPKQESPKKASAVTPGKLRTRTMMDRQPESKEAPPFTSALLKDRLLIKQPGAVDAPFPAKDQVHVRGETRDAATSRSQQNMASLPYRKRKHVRALPSKDDSILSRFADRLHPEPDRALNSDGFSEPPSDLYVPERSIMCGDDIAMKVSRQLSFKRPDREADILGLATSEDVHPALRSLQDKIPRIMTAYDESRGESFAWTQKYAPSKSTEVLQPAEAMIALSDWLKSLAVQAVVGAAVAAPGAQRAKPVIAKKKRKKTSSELDDFLVDSDEELEVDSKISNAVLLQGPHGCGKTAAAYAVAKELGFKVFEISSSERRSGRDVLDKIGDMTENHLVRHHGAPDSTEASVADDSSRMDEAFQKDLQSGKQGKMNAFFKAQPGPALKQKPKPKAKAQQTESKTVTNEQKLKTIQEAIRKPPKDQQQSLILLEEVDILFKDDKEFWTTVLKLIKTSKRPVILTCNDEDLVPIQSISLHTTLHFSRPPLDLATDYLLLVAAAEGHVLEREAVASLYLRHGFDLRATLMELDFWCQMGVGDTRGGLSWIYQRWPPGSDLDGLGRKLRIVSNHTYQQGLGLDYASNDDDGDTLLRAWSELDTDPVTVLGWDGMADRLPSLSTTTSLPERYRHLKRMSDFASMLSAADACSHHARPEVAPFDPTAPELRESARNNYTDTMAVKQTDERLDHMNMSKSFYVSIVLSAHRTYECTDVAIDDSPRTMLERKRTANGIDALDRHAFSCFDAIAAPSDMSAGTSGGLQQSVFDSPLNVIALDLAPYVRSIVQYDQALEEQRDRLDRLTSNGRRTKRARTTRAARSALEGGQRATVRRERWFTPDLDISAVLATGGHDWPRLRATDMSVDGYSKDGTEDTDAPMSSAEHVAPGSEDEIQYD